jgi:hypothetical protein
MAATNATSLKIEALKSLYHCCQEKQLLKALGFKLLYDNMADIDKVRKFQAKY